MEHVKNTSWGWKSEFSEIPDPDRNSDKSRNATLQSLKLMCKKKGDEKPDGDEEDGDVARLGYNPFSVLTGRM